jgi:hypothetical protein
MQELVTWQRVLYYTDGKMGDAMQQSNLVNEAAIWNRIIQPMEKTLPPDAAKFFLDLGFAPSDIQRMHELTSANQSGTLTEGEQEELRRYQMVGLQVDFLRSISRRSLARP